MKQTTAAIEYAERHARIAELMDRIAKAAKAHAERAAADPQNWGYAGDLGHLEELLKQALASVGGK